MTPTRCNSIRKNSWGMPFVRNVQVALTGTIFYSCCHIEAPPPPAAHIPDCPSNTTLGRIKCGHSSGICTINIFPPQSVILPVRPSQRWVNRSGSSINHPHASIWRSSGVFRCRLALTRSPLPLHALAVTVHIGVARTEQSGAAPPSPSPVHGGLPDAWFVTLWAWLTKKNVLGDRVSGWR
jgi:hypothetical protein